MMAWVSKRHVWMILLLSPPTVTDTVTLIVVVVGRINGGRLATVAHPLPMRRRRRRRRRRSAR